MKKFNHQAKLVKKYRKKRNLTQAEVAKHLSIKCAQFISNVERAKMGYTVGHIPLLAELFRIKPSLLIEAKVEDYRESISSEVYFS